VHEKHRNITRSVTVLKMHDSSVTSHDKFWVYEQHCRFAL